MLGGQDYLSRLNSPTAWTQQSVQSYRNVARSICEVTYTSSVGQGAYLLTVRFDVVEGQHQSVSDALRQHVLPPVADKQGITGVHLCVADEAVSKVETAEKKARAEGTQIPAWIVMIEGCAPDYVRVAGESFVAELQRLLEGQSMKPETTLYQLEYTRCKTPGSAG